MGIFSYNGRKLQKRRFLMEDRRMSLNEWIEVYTSLTDPKQAQAHHKSLSPDRSNQKISEHESDARDDYDYDDVQPVTTSPPDLTKQSTIISCADLVTESLPPVLQFRKTRSPYSGFIPSMTTASSDEVDADADADVIDDTDDDYGNRNSKYGKQLRILAQQLPDNMYPISLSPSSSDGQGNWSAGSLAPLATIEEDADGSVDAYPSSSSAVTAPGSPGAGVWYYQQSTERRGSASSFQKNRDGNPGRRPRLMPRSSVASTSTSSVNVSASASSFSVGSTSALSEVRLYGSCPTRCSD